MDKSKTYSSNLPYILIEVDDNLHIKFNWSNCAILLYMTVFFSVLGHEW